MAGPVRVFIACSLDGFIAGPDGDLSWLPEPSAVILGGGTPLFAGVTTRRTLSLRSSTTFAGGLVQLRYALGP